MNPFDTTFDHGTDGPLIEDPHSDLIWPLIGFYISILEGTPEGSLRS